MQISTYFPCIYLGLANVRINNSLTPYLYKGSLQFLKEVGEAGFRTQAPWAKNHLTFFNSDAKNEWGGLK